MDWALGLPRSDYLTKKLLPKSLADTSLSSIILKYPIAGKTKFLSVSTLIIMELYVPARVSTQEKYFAAHQFLLPVYSPKSNLSVIFILSRHIR